MLLLKVAKDVTAYVNTSIVNELRLEP